MSAKCHKQTLAKFIRLPHLHAFGAAFERVERTCEITGRF